MTATTVNRLLLVAFAIFCFSYVFVAEEATPAADQNMAKAIEDLQAELASVKKELSRLRGYRKWSKFWISTTVTHVNQCGTHSDKRHADGPECTWIKGFTYTPGMSE